eukprot:COSAG01_NODE_3336_length_6236_cov_4.059801_2_plen_141_part_00
MGRHKLEAVGSVLQQALDEGPSRAYASLRRIGSTQLIVEVVDRVRVEASELDVIREPGGLDALLLSPRAQETMPHTHTPVQRPQRIVIAPTSQSRHSRCIDAGAMRASGGSPPPMPCVRTRGSPTGTNHRRCCCRLARST